MNRDISEAELIRLVKSQTKEGFDILYDNYSSAFYGVICRSITDTAIAEDILQEVFVKIWKYIDKYDPDKGRLYTWMLQITRNTCLDYIRSPSYKNQKATELNEKNFLNTSYEMQGHDIGLVALIEKLEPKHRDVIATIFYKSYTHHEAAKYLDIPVGTLKTRARNALLILRASLQLNAQLQTLSDYGSKLIPSRINRK